MFVQEIPPRSFLFLVSVLNSHFALPCFVFLCDCRSSICSNKLIRITLTCQTRAQYTCPFQTETRALALKVLQELVRTKPELFHEFACLFVIKVLEACRDGEKTVSHSHYFTGLQTLFCIIRFDGCERIIFCFCWAQCNLKNPDSSKSLDYSTTNRCTLCITFCRSLTVTFFVTGLARMFAECFILFCTPGVGFIS